MKKWHFVAFFVLCMVVGTISGAHGNGSKGKGPQDKSKKKLYRIVLLSSDSVKLISDIHLIPPGSKLLHKKITFKDIGALPDKDILIKKARVDIDFFEKKLRGEVGKEKQIEFDMALFNIYKDFMGNYTTDLVHMVYKTLKGNEKK